MKGEDQTFGECVPEYQPRDVPMYSGPKSGGSMYCYLSSVVTLYDHLYTTNGPCVIGQHSNEPTSQV